MGAAEAPIQLATWGGDTLAPMSATVTIFNTSPMQISLMVNNGNQVMIGGTWAPLYVPQSSTAVSFDPGGPLPNALGPGTNSITVIPSGSPQPMSFQINVPTNAPVQSLQLYLSLGNNSVSWVLLNGGFVAGSGSV